MEQVEKQEIQYFAAFYANLTFPLRFSESQVFCCPQISRCVSAEVAADPVAFSHHECYHYIDISQKNTHASFDIELHLYRT